MRIVASPFVQYLMRCGVLVSALILVACAGPRAMKDDSGQPIPLPPATFKLNQPQVKWEPHADYGVQGVIRGRNQGQAKDYAAKAGNDLETMYALLKVHAKDDLTASLEGKGVVSGTQQTIVLRPLYGYYDQNGWGSGVVIQISVLDQASSKSWTYRVKADTGLQWLGASVAPSPDRAFVQSFASGLVSLFWTAGLLP